jgi:hypothetical protein
MSMVLEGMDATMQSLGFSRMVLDAMSFFSTMAKILSIPMLAPTDGIYVVENIPMSWS